MPDFRFDNVDNLKQGLKITLSFAQGAILDKILTSCLCSFVLEFPQYGNVKKKTFSGLYLLHLNIV